jgi:hypothetical protein
LLVPIKNHVTHLISLCDDYKSIPDRLLAHYENMIFAFFTARSHSTIDVNLWRFCMIVRAQEWCLYKNYLRRINNVNPNVCSWTFVKWEEFFRRVMRTSMYFDVNCLQFPNLYHLMSSPSIASSQAQKSVSSWRKN